jgi:hypothetical protein
VWDAVVVGEGARTKRELSGSCETSEIAGHPVAGDHRQSGGDRVTGEDRACPVVAPGESSFIVQVPIAITSM